MPLADDRRGSVRTTKVRRKALHAGGLLFAPGVASITSIIDSDNKCHGDANGPLIETSHPPFGLGVLDFDAIVPELAKAARVSHDWWTIDLCFWPDAWAATETCKKALDGLIGKYGK